MSADVKKSKHHHYLTGFGGKTRAATRHLAALDFLLHIPMQNEAKIIQSNGGIDRGPCSTSAENAQLTGDSVEAVNAAVELGELNNLRLLRQQEELSGHAPGRKLDGKSAPTGRLNVDIRYKLAKLTEQSALVRQWEDSLLRGHGEYKQALLPSRIFYSRARGYPLCVMSVLHYAPEAEQAKMEKNMNVDSIGLAAFDLPVRDWRGNSYMSILQEEPEDDARTNEYLFEPNALDDPDIVQGKHRYVLFGSDKTGPLVSSVLLYVNDEDLQEDLNEQFRETHPQLPHGLTLSKIRNLKRTALVACLNAQIEISTVATACIGFERLCLMGIVTKSNRRLSMAVMLLLATKLSEETVCSDGPKKIESILQFADREWSISKRQIFAAEFGAFVHLGLSLKYPEAHVTLMINRLLKLVHMNVRSYLGEKANSLYKQNQAAIDSQCYDIF